MNQAAYQEMTKMLTGFPQSQADIMALLLTYDEDLTGISDQAICETAQRYRRGEIPDQNKTFAPSIAEFVDSARRQEEYISLRNRPRLAPPVLRPQPRSEPLQRRTEEELERQRERMAKFHHSDKPDPEADLAAIRAKYDPELLAKVPDAPLPKGMVQVGQPVKKFVA